MLGARCGRGLIAMEQGAHRDAADLLHSVLVEDPTYTVAATGLRLVYARLDGDRTVIDLRNEIGYGSASAGRSRSFDSVVIATRQPSPSAPSACTSERA